jgi:hypothetical protein
MFTSRLANIKDYTSRDEAHVAEVAKLNCSVILLLGNLDGQLTLYEEANYVVTSGLVKPSQLVVVSSTKVVS